MVNSGHHHITSTHEYLSETHHELEAARQNLQEAREKWEASITVMKTAALTLAAAQTRLDRATALLRSGDARLGQRHGFDE